MPENKITNAWPFLADVRVVTRWIRSDGKQETQKVPNARRNDRGQCNKQELVLGQWGTYIAALPADPQTNNGVSVTDCTTDYVTGYNIIQSAANNRLTVSAPGVELGDVISVTR